MDPDPRLAAPAYACSASRSSGTTSGPRSLCSIDAARSASCSAPSTREDDFSEWAARIIATWSPAEIAERTRPISCGASRRYTEIRRPIASPITSRSDATAEWSRSCAAAYLLPRPETQRSRTAVS